MDPLTAALAGVASSIGPCVAPRYLAVAALTGGRTPWRPVVAFTLGIVVATVALGAGATVASASVIMALVAHVAAIDAIVALALIVFGIATLVRDPHRCEGAHVRDARSSGAFALGAVSAFVVSPCCTPLIVAFAGLGAFARDPWYAAASLGAFALGHAAPLLLAGIAGATLAAPLRALAASAAPAVVSGSLTIALGAYYAVLA
jgi:cytochrome c biogenesis protein CcdA